MTIVDESDVSSGDEQKYIKQVKKNLRVNEQVDNELAKSKLKEKRIKLKKRLRDIEGDKPSGGYELGRASDDSDDAGSDIGD